MSFFNPKSLFFCFATSTCDGYSYKYKNFYIDLRS